ncbi:MAG: hypothetical protein MZU79_02355 [Anaerotruncus sp.]|nr:hypothetical protein [Anaerotruncus sp.]
MILAHWGGNVVVGGRRPSQRLGPVRAGQLQPKESILFFQCLSSCAIGYGACSAGGQSMGGVRGPDARPGDRRQAGGPDPGRG